MIVDAVDHFISLLEIDDIHFILIIINNLLMIQHNSMISTLFIAMLSGLFACLSSVTAKIEGSILDMIFTCCFGLKIQNNASGYVANSRCAYKNEVEDLGDGNDKEAESDIAQMVLNLLIKQKYDKVIFIIMFNLIMMRLFIKAMGSGSSSTIMVLLVNSFSNLFFSSMFDCFYFFSDQQRMRILSDPRWMIGLLLSFIGLSCFLLLSPESKREKESKRD